MKSLILPILCISLLCSCSNKPPKISMIPYVEIEEDSFLIYKNMLDNKQDTLNRLYRKLDRQVKSLQTTP